MANKIRTLQKTATTAGTSYAISASDLVVSEFTIKARKGNAGIIYVGDSTVTNSTTSGGFPISANESLSAGGLKDMDGRINLKDVYIVGDTNSDGVVVAYVQRNQSF